MLHLHPKAYREAIPSTVHKITCWGISWVSLAQLFISCNAFRVCIHVISSTWECSFTLTIISLSFIFIFALHCELKRWFSHSYGITSLANCFCFSCIYSLRKLFSFHLYLIWWTLWVLLKVRISFSENNWKYQLYNILLHSKKFSLYLSAIFGPAGIHIEGVTLTSVIISLLGSYPNPQVKGINSSFPQYQFTTWKVLEVKPLFTAITLIPLMWTLNYSPLSNVIAIKSILLFLVSMRWSFS